MVAGLIVTAALISALSLLYMAYCSWLDRVDAKKEATGKTVIVKSNIMSAAEMQALWDRVPPEQRNAGPLRIF